MTLWRPDYGPFDLRAMIAYYRDQVRKQLVAGGIDVDTYRFPDGSTVDQEVEAQVVGGLIASTCDDLIEVFEDDRRMINRRAWLNHFPRPSTTIRTETLTNLGSTEETR